MGLVLLATVLTLAVTLIVLVSLKGRGGSSRRTTSDQDPANPDRTNDAGFVPFVDGSTPGSGASPAAHGHHHGHHGHHHGHTDTSGSHGGHTHTGGHGGQTLAAIHSGGGDFGGGHSGGDGGGGGHH